MRAINVGDLAHARTHGFRARVSGALRTIDQAREKGRIGVSFSGGKDSTVLLDLVRSVAPDSPAAFYDSGLEYPSTYEVVAHYGVETIAPQRSLPDMLRDGGYWGYTHPSDPEARFDFFAFLVGEPSQRFADAHGLGVMAIGLRAQESGGRRMNAWRRGELYYAKSSGRWHLCPVVHWHHDDVWAYIAHHGLRYNAAYDQMMEIGVPRDDWRVSTLIGLCGVATRGRFAWLRQMEPALFRRLAAEFPGILEYT